MLHLSDAGQGRALTALLSDKGKGGVPHVPRLVVPVENIFNVPELVGRKDLLNLGLDIVIGPHGQYLCDIRLHGLTVDIPGVGGIQSKADPVGDAAGDLPQPTCPDDWRPLAYLPNIRSMSPTGATLKPGSAKATIRAASGFLYAAASPNEIERFRRWKVQWGANARIQPLADRAVLEMDVADINLAVTLKGDRGSVDLKLCPPPGDSAADVTVAISSHCCLAATPPVAEGESGPRIEDLEGYEQFVSGSADFSKAAIQQAGNTPMTVGNPRCPSGVWE